MRYFVAIFFIAAFLSSNAALAAEPTRVAVSPFVYFPANTALGHHAARDAVVNGMERWVGNEVQHFSLSSVSSLRRRIVSVPGYENALEVARLRTELGVKSYRELDPAAAADNLLIAQEQFFRADHHFVDPAEVSEVLLFRALALLDTKGGSVTGPLEAMKQMLLIDPTREVQEGAYPEEVVRFYQGARLELERDVREGGPGEALPKRIAELSRERDASAGVHELDYVLVGNVLPANGDAVELVVWLYDVAAEQFQVPASIVVASPSPDRLGAASNRLASRLLSCLVEPVVGNSDPLPPSGGEGPFAVHANMAYASYLQFPSVGGQVVEPFDNIGAGLGATVYLTREFGLIGMFQFLSSTTEYSGLVQPGFTTLRFLGGGEVGIGLARFRVSLGTLIELTSVGRITTCPGSEGVADRRFCDPSDEVEPQLLLGLNVLPRLSYGVLDSLRFFAGGSSSFYFLRPAGDSLNFLTAAEAGLEYRF